MSKLSLDRVTSSFGFQAALNSVLSDIEKEFSEKVLYRDNPIGEVNNMHNDLDMSGNDVLNVGLISADDFRVNGQDLGETVNSLVAKIDDALDEVNTAVDKAEDFADEAEGWANAAQVAATTVAYNKHEGVLLTGERVINLPWPYDVSVGVEVFLSGVKQVYSSLIFTDSTTVTLADVDGVLEDTPYEVVSTSRAQSQLGTQLADPNGSSLVGFLQSGTGAVARTVQSKMKDVVSVNDFGAVGDGVADDTVAIRAALDSTDGLVYVPTGVYSVAAGKNQSTTIEYGELVRLVGDGVLYSTVNDEYLGTYQGGGAISQGVGGLVVAPSVPDNAYGSAYFQAGGMVIRQYEPGFPQFVQTRPGTPQVLELITGSIRMVATKVSGTNELLYVSGAGVNTFITGLPLMLSEQGGDTEKYIVKSTGAGKVVVEAANGDPVVFASNNAVLVYQPCALNHCRVNVSGSDIYFLKDTDYERPQFVFAGYALTNEHVWVYVDGSWYKVTAVAANPDSSLYWQVLTVSGAPTGGERDATQAHFWDRVAAIRVKPVDGGGDECGVDLAAYPDRYVLEVKGKTAGLERKLEINAAQGLILQPDGDDTYTNGDMVVRKVGGGTVYVKDFTTGNGGRITGDALNNMSLRAANAGFVDVIEIRTSDHQFRVTSNGSLVLKAAYNTTNSAANINMSSLPKATSAPAWLASGDLWWNTTDNSIRIKP